MLMDTGQGRDVDMLLGLDMLKAHQACIDLERNCLRIQGQEIKFLSEHELPDKARQETGREQPLEPSGSGGAGGASKHRDSKQSFPGSGNALGSTPGSRDPSPGDSISTLMGLGATREQAIAALQNAEGNVDIAASLLFNF